MDGWRKKHGLRPPFTPLFPTKTTQASKLHFGVILGWTVAGSAAVWVVASSLAAAAAADGGGGGGGGASASGGGVGWYETTCQVGYGLLPLVVASAASLLLPRAPGGGAGGAARALVCGGAGWGALTAASLVSARAPALRPHRALIAYPCALLYGALALLTLYHRSGGGKGG
jgi:protein YIPF5/7